MTKADTAWISEELNSLMADYQLSLSAMARLLPGDRGTIHRWSLLKQRPPRYLGRALRDLRRELSEGATT
jgi:hypothetical protein